MALILDGTEGVSSTSGTQVIDGMTLDAAAPATTIVTTSAGNVGIGAASPSSLLHLSSASPRLTLTDTDTGADHRINADSGAGNLAFDVDYNSDTASPSVVFNIKGTERMRVDSAGNLLVGKTSTGYTTVGVRLGPLGLSQFAHNTGGSTNIQMSAPVSDSQVAFYRQDTGGLMGSISNGASNTVTYNTSSDYRLKHDIIPMTNALARVQTLKPVFWKWNVDGASGQGFIAHELQAVLPDCVAGEKDATREETYEVTPAVPATQDLEGNELTAAIQSVMGTRTVPSYQGVDTSFLVATLTAAIQEQQATIEALTARITALETV